MILKNFSDLLTPMLPWVRVRIERGNLEAKTPCVTQQYFLIILSGSKCMHEKGREMRGANFAPPKITLQ